ALRIDPDHPQALLRLAWRQLGNDQTEAAMATARHLLAVEPGQGDAFAVLALAAAKRGDANAEALAKIALQRAPRNRDLRTQEATRRSEEHTSELQSRENLVCRLLLEK